MKVVVVIADDWMSIFSKPMEVNKVRSFVKRCGKGYYVYTIRKYNIIERLLMLKNKIVR